MEKWTGTGGDRPETSTTSGIRAPSSNAFPSGAVETGRRERPGWSAVGSWLVFLLGTLRYLGPELQDLQGTLGPDLGDPRLNLYLLEWGRHQLASGFQDFWNLPIFHPEWGMTLLSDHLLGLLPFYAGAVWLGATPPGAYNLLLFASFVFGGWGAWWVLRSWGLRGIPAILGGWLWAFAHFRWNQLSHLQVLWAPTLLPALWAFDRLLERWSPRRALGFFGLFLLQVSAGVYLAIFLQVGCGVLLLARGWPDWKRILLRSSKVGWGALAGAVLAANAIFLFPYRARPEPPTRVQARHELKRYGATVESFLSPCRYGWTDRLGLLPTAYRGALFVGFVPAFLMGSLLLSRFRVWKVAISAIRWPTAVAGLSLTGVGIVAGDRATWRIPWTFRGEELGYSEAFFLLAAGIAVTWWSARPARLGLRLREASPQVHRLLWLGVSGLLLALPATLDQIQNLVQPLRSLRASPRAFLLLLPLLCYLTARGAEVLLGRCRWPSLRLAAGLGLWALLGLELQPGIARGAWQALPARAEEFPGYARKLASLPDVRAYLELPLRPYWQETERMYHQSLHWKPLVNGYSASIPSSYGDWAGLWDPVPTEEGLRTLLRGGITHVVFHRDLEQPAVRDQIEAWFERQAALGRGRIEFFEDGVWIVRLPQPAAP